MSLELRDREIRGKAKAKAFNAEGAEVSRRARRRDALRFMVPPA
jgi:hypothetical protein